MKGRGVIIAVALGLWIVVAASKQHAEVGSPGQHPTPSPAATVAVPAGPTPATAPARPATFPASHPATSPATHPAAAPRPRTTLGGPGQGSNRAISPSPDRPNGSDWLVAVASAVALALSAATVTLTLTRRGIRPTK